MDEPWEGSPEDLLAATAAALAARGRRMSEFAAALVYEVILDGDSPDQAARELIARSRR